MDDRSVARPGQQSTYEMRECRSCYGSGQVVEDVELMTGEIVAESMTCPICKGAGEVSVYLYPMRRRRS